jgi:Mrp family chromosome partitioning ATPase
MLINNPESLRPLTIGGEPSAPEQDTLDIDTILRFARRNRRLVLAWILACLSAACVYAVMTPSQYTAFGTILIQDPTPRGPAGLPAEAAHAAFMESQIQVLRSEEVLGRVADRKRLVDDPEFGGAGEGLRAFIVNSVRSLLGARKSPKSNEPRHATVLRVRNDLTITQLGVSNAVEIGFTSRSPARAAEIATAIIQSYVDGRLEAARSEREEMAASLQRRLTELHNKAFGTQAVPDSSTSAASEEQARARFRELQITTETYRALYTNLLQREYSDAEAQSPSAGVRVLNPAEPPLRPSRPNLPLVFALALVAGGGMGVGHALFRQITGRPPRMLDDLRPWAAPEQLAGVPWLAAARWKPEGSPPACVQAAYTRVSPGLYQAIDRLAIRLQGGQVRARGLVIAVAAPTTGAGASTVAAHIARIISESGQKTLLVDANWRKTDPNETAMAGKAVRRLKRTLVPAPLSPDGPDILMLRQSGPISELNAATSILATFVDELPRYDCLVVDFQSAAQTLDLAASMAAIGQVCVVTEAGRTPPESLERMLQLIPREKLAAIILNKMRASR